MNLSIIIPVYNAAEFLESNFYKLEKVYKLIHENAFEIIYVNDGSTDNSGEVLEQIKTFKQNIIVIHQENQGSSRARNTGIDVAQGEYIQFLDADDFIDWDKVIPLLNTAVKNNLDAISYRIDFVDEEGNPTGSMTKHPLTYNKIMTGPQALIEGFQPSSICCWFFKNNFLKKNNLFIVPNITHEDVEFSVRLLISAKRVLFEDIVAYYYVTHSDSVTQPATRDKLEKYLVDEIIVAAMIRDNIIETTPIKLMIALEKNYNSVVWNLLWYFYKNKNKVSEDFKVKCIEDLKELNLYPIKGPLKTPFQKVTSTLMNQPKIFKYLTS